MNGVSLELIIEIAMYDVADQYAGLLLFPFLLSCLLSVRVLRVYGLFAVNIED